MADPKNPGGEGGDTGGGGAVIPPGTMGDITKAFKDPAQRVLKDTSAEDLQNILISMEAVNKADQKKIENQAQQIKNEYRI